MEPKLGEVIDVVDEMVPGALAEDWDNSGLQVGDRHWHVERVWVALDPLPEVIAAAGASGVDLLITHHPLIFKPLSVIDTRTMEGAAVQQALAHQVAVFSAHTNLDRTYEGVNDVLAAKIGLDDIRPLPMESAQDAPGFGRIGKLAQAVTFFELVQTLKKTMGLERVRTVGNLETVIETVVVCSGSGSSMVKAFFDTGADVFISGDLRYHEARAFEFLQKALIDIGHFASEHIIVESLAGRLKSLFARQGWEIDMAAYSLEKDPFVIL